MIWAASWASYLRHPASCTEIQILHESTYCSSLFVKFALRHVDCAIIHNMSPSEFVIFIQLMFFTLQFKILESDDLNRVTKVHQMTIETRKILLTAWSCPNRPLTLVMKALDLWGIVGIPELSYVSSYRVQLRFTEELIEMLLKSGATLTHETSFEMLETMLITAMFLLSHRDAHLWSYLTSVNGRVIPERFEPYNDIVDILGSILRSFLLSTDTINNEFWDKFFDASRIIDTIIFVAAHSPQSGRPNKMLRWILRALNQSNVLKLRVCCWYICLPWSAWMELIRVFHETCTRLDQRSRNTIQTARCSTLYSL